MRRRRMGALVLGDHPALNLHTTKDHSTVAEEIKGLIRVYSDGHVDRAPVMPEVRSTWAPEPNITSKDIIINQQTGLWARFYTPKSPANQHYRLPLLVYFHGGGFCVGSTAWICYHEFLAKLSSRSRCVIMSVNYRLAPEHRLPAAYEDGITAVKWLQQQETDSCLSSEFRCFRAQCDFARVFLAGDSAGGAIAHQAAAQLGPGLQGLVLIQPFFGGEARTTSETGLVQPEGSALSLRTSDSYWRLALPKGSNRDHKWCNPLARGSPRLESLRMPSMLVCISETDILRERNLEYCWAMRKAGKNIEHRVYAGVGHAFQVLNNSHISWARTDEMLAHITAFISSR